VVRKGLRSRSERLSREVSVPRPAGWVECGHSANVTTRGRRRHWRRRRDALLRLVASQYLTTQPEKEKEGAPVSWRDKRSTTQHSTRKGGRRRRRREATAGASSSGLTRRHLVSRHVSLLALPARFQRWWSKKRSSLETHAPSYLFILSLTRFRGLRPIKISCYGKPVPGRIMWAGMKIR